MAVSVPALVLQELVQSVDKGYFNRNDSIKLNRKNMPLLDFWNSRKKTVDMNQGAVRVGLIQADTGDNQGWTNLDLLGFSENAPTMAFEFGVYNLHRGLLLVADYLMNAGFSIDFNSQSKTVGTPLSKSEATRLRNILAEKIDNWRDAANVSLDRDLHLDGTIDTKRPIGLDAMLPLNYLGTYGGIARSNPLIQHYFATGLTYGVGGTIESGLNTAFWQARLNGRGQKRGSYRIICGRGFADRYRAYARANNMHINVTAEQVKTLDVNISDSGLRYMGIPLEIDPTFDDLDALYAPTIPWTRRCYILHEESFVLGLFDAKDWSTSVAAPKAEERSIRMSADFRLSPFCTNPNTCAVVAAAA